MILIISTDQKFIKFSSELIESAGYLSILSNYEEAIDVAIASKADVALVHSDANTEERAKECVSTLALRVPEIKILAAIEKRSDSPSLYLDIEGCHREIYLPCTPDDMRSALIRLSPSEISVNVLEIRSGRKGVFLLNEAMPLSKTDYAILRLTAKAYPGPLDVKSLRSLLPEMSENCLAVHINAINKAAARITERRLIVFKNGYKLNEFM